MKILLTLHPNVSIKCAPLAPEEHMSHILRKTLPVVRRFVGKAGMATEKTIFF